MTKSQSYKRSVQPDRNAWRDEMPARCMCCGRPEGGRHPQMEIPIWLEVHEILSKADLPNRWWFRANALLLCQPCHQELPSRGDAAQLAIKRRCDPAHYDLEEWLRRRNPRAMEYVTEAEVAAV